MILKHLCVKTMTKRLWISKIRISHIKKKKRKIETKNFTLKTTYSNNLLLLTKEIKIKIFCKIQRFGNRISQYFVSQSPSNKHRWSTDDETSSSNIPTGMSPTIVLLSSRFETIFQPWSLSFVTYVESRSSKGSPTRPSLKSRGDQRSRIWGYFNFETTLPLLSSRGR